MLVLTRKVGERIHVGDTVTITVVRIQGDKVRIGVQAPANVGVHREEVYRRLQAQAPGDKADAAPSRGEALVPRRGARPGA